MESGRRVLDNSRPTTQYIDANGIRFAYQRFGSARGVPLLLNQHFKGTLGHWDPLVTGRLAEGREVIAFNNAGVGSSTGNAPSSVQDMAINGRAFVDALGLDQVDVLGFSLGGLVAQEICMQAPQLVRRVILTSAGLPHADMSMSKASGILGATYAVADHLWLAVHFTGSVAGQEAGRAYLDRVRPLIAADAEVSEVAACNQREAISTYLSGRQRTRDELARVFHRALIVHGGNDVMMPPINAFALQETLPNAQLVLYPDANHSPMSRDPELFAQQATAFLDRPQ